MDFPDIRPRSRAFTPGPAPVRSFRSLSGAVRRRAYGDRPNGHQLSLGYRCTRAVAYDFQQHYFENMTLTGFGLPDEVWADEDLARMRESLDLDACQWFWAGEPQSVAIEGFPGMREVSVNLLGEYI
jgi:hypothetical protein